MENGILFLDKPAGLSSRDVDDELEKKLGGAKVGHLGTLDPFATGLLVIGVNKGTKYLSYLDDAKKTYVATLHLGERSSTLDPEGKILETRDVPPLDEKIVAEALTSFLGKREQIPPMTSAIKVDGEALYKKAHLGESVERKPRPVEIFSLNLVSYKAPDLVFSCTVSRGTYIRVLGEEIAAKLGTIGYLTALRRSGVGPFLLALAKPLEEIGFPDVLEPTVFITTMKHVEIEEKEKDDVLHGRGMLLQADYGEKVLLCLHGEALAVYRRLKDSFYQPERGLF